MDSPSQPRTRDMNNYEEPAKTRNIALAPQSFQFNAPTFGAVTKQSAPSTTQLFGAQEKPSQFQLNIVPPNAPEWVVPNSSFETSKGYKECFEEVKNQLTVKNCDIEVNAGNFQIKAVHCNPLCQFFVNLYLSANGGTIVEFQRQSGDAFGFGGIYNHVQSAIEPTEAACAFSLPSLDFDAFPEMDLDLPLGIVSSFDNICELINDKYFEVRLEGLNSLVSLLQQNASALSGDEVDKIIDLVKGVFDKTNDFECTHSALVCLGYIISQTSDSVSTLFLPLMDIFVQDMA